MKIIKPALRSLVSLVLIVVSFTFQSCSESNKYEPSIGENGNLRKIVIPENANEVIKFAASELQGYLKKITGKELQIKKADSKINN